VRGSTDMGAILPGCLIEAAIGEGLMPA
jgi:hypothetical protein